MDLFRLVYISEKAEDVQLEDLNVMIDKAQPRNRRRHLTGVLCLHNERFLQVLEGDSKWVNELYSKISLDDRHKNVKLLSMKKVDERSFHDFDMHFIHDEFLFDFMEIAKLDPSENSEYQENALDNYLEHICEKVNQLKV